MDSTTTAAERELRPRIDAIEKAYEYFLAYAAQGLTHTNAADRDGEARRHLEASVAALDGLGTQFRAAVAEQPESAGYHDFVEALERDASATSAAFRIALSRPAISSQLIDNLNASVHVRALLTDLFVLDEALQIPVLD